MEAEIMLKIVAIAIAVPIVGLFVYAGIRHHFARERIREIKVIQAKKTVRDLPYDPKTHTGVKSHYKFENTSIDFVYVGKKHIHTYFCSESLIKKLRPGHTYTVRMKYPAILNIEKRK